VTGLAGEGGELGVVADAVQQGMKEQGAAGGATAAGGEGDELHGGAPVEGGVGEGRAQEIEGAVVGGAKVLDGAHPDPAKSFLELDNIAGTIATQNRVDGPTLAACLKSQDKSIVNSSLKLGTSLGLEGTPQVFVNGERLQSGARPIEELWPAIDRALKAQGIQPPPVTASVSSTAQQSGH
jgi:hypothetical protein